MRVTAAAMTLGLAAPVCAQTALPPPTLSTNDLIANHQRKTDVIQRCPTEISDDIVVCGRGESARQRLPLPELDAPAEGEAFVKGEMPRASARPVKQGSCGTLTTDKPCVAGLPVIPMIVSGAKIVRKLVDPESGPEEPPIPERFRGAGH